MWHVSCILFIFLLKCSMAAHLFSHRSGTYCSTHFYLWKNKTSPHPAIYFLITLVAPTLFLALSTIPHISQVSYIGLDGLLFSLNNYADQTYAVFSNASFSSNWYTQPINRDTGKLYGAAVASDSKVIVNASWFQAALNSTSGYSWLGRGWDKAQGSLFMSTVVMDGKGVISLGIPAKFVVDHFAALDFHGGYFHLATADGHVIVQSKLPKTQFQISNNTVSVQTMRPNGNITSNLGHFPCNTPDDDDDDNDNDGGNGDKLGSSYSWKLKGTKYRAYCSTLEIIGVQSVYVLTCPANGLANLDHKSVVLLGILLFIILVSVCIFIFLIIRAARREMILCARIIKQEGVTRQAERKSMNKTKAFSRASHDVRASLAAITGLIELCHQDANPDSELAANLAQMDTCTNDLLGILNSVLDISKIEAGKVQLEIEEFNLAQLLEDVVDMFYPIAIKKGVDIVLDPCDDSIVKTCNVRGDRGKLKQIMCNLLSNAVKFTSEGHITVRAMVPKTSYENEIIASNHNRVLNCLSWLFYKSTEDFNDLDALHTSQKDPNNTKFVIEVDDTGEGIPRDKREFVFENFVQVTDRATGKEGSGLGLGIVESLVRLMGGEIRILDKENGERGTCFSFDVSLLTCKPKSGDIEEESRIMHSDRSANAFQPFGIQLLVPSPKQEGSHVVLFIEGDERRKILVKYISRLNIKVSYVTYAKNLLPQLEKIKRKLDISYFNYSEKSQQGFHDQLSTSAFKNSDSRASDGSQSTKDEDGRTCRKINSRNSPASIVLVVIDTNGGAFSELYTTMASFRKDIHNSRCKVVWLDSSITRNTHLLQMEGCSLAPPNDYIIYKPFHGSRLYKVLGLLPELKGCNLPKLEMRKQDEEAQQIDLKLATNESGMSSSLQQVIIHKCVEKKSDQELLHGSKVLVVDDDRVTRKVIANSLQRLGAVVEVLENGKEAFEQVFKALSDHSKKDHSNSTLYDYIFMDCQMPIMHGFEATRLIRMEEKQYGIHLRIIALTCHATTEEVSKTLEAGMDVHLTKPFKMDRFMRVIKSFEDK
ncbi:histidine kinase CKI1-like [Pyrus ussuriensis x Pyrus communis]|uniref:histidine kinase n=1 Tax=Pyrus ussuriensis x Pyrus communis TaxID=2448454 RepID=A0A5N5H169_9ROSA|nr:histidine kinase CKI1-like [Pyrus ussuriensis x Pyrus communis]